MSEDKSLKSVSSTDGDLRAGCVSCARYTLVVSNTLFFALGILLLCVGIWFRWVPANINLLSFATTSSTNHYIMTSTLVFVAAGAATIMLSVIGCCGAVSNSKYVLGMFFLFLVVLFVLLVGVATLGIWLESKVKADIPHQLHNTFIMSYNGDNGTDPVSLFWNHIQSDLHCCGIATPNGHLDYSNAYIGITEDDVEIKGAKYWRDNNVTQWPSSCCTRENRNNFVDLANCQFNTEANPARYSEGCKEKVEKFLSNSFLLTAAVAAILAVIEAVHFCTVRQLEAAMLHDDRESVATKFSLDQVCVQE